MSNIKKILLPLKATVSNNGFRCVHGVEGMNLITSFFKQYRIRHLLFIPGIIPQYLTAASLSILFVIHY